MRRFILILGGGRGGRIGAVLQCPNQEGIKGFAFHLHLVNKNALRLGDVAVHGTLDVEEVLQDVFNVV